VRGTTWVTCEELAGDASSRRYRRLTAADGTTAVEVVYPEGEAGRMVRDLEVARWLAARGVRVPRVLAVGPGARAVLEDAGTVSAAAWLAALPEPRRERAAAALLEPLAALAAIPPRELPPWSPPLDAELLRWELAGFELWVLRFGLGVTPDAATGAWLDALAARVAAHPRRVCHRDYHLDNLFPRPDGTVVVLDVQDARVGPDTYDIASLLGERDMPRLLSEPARRRLAAAWARRTRAAPGWERRLLETTVQRRLKVAGTFARLVACGREGYRRWLDDTLRALAATLPGLAAPPGLVGRLLEWVG